MRILIAPDSFKGSVPSMLAAQAIAEGIRSVFPHTSLHIFPVADGGEGTVDAVLHLPGTRRITIDTKDPLGRTIRASYAWMENRKTAVIETAAASGLPLLQKHELRPDLASTYGTGLLIRDALDRGARKIVLGLGGSATVDAGTGILVALGVRFLDELGNPLKGCGGSLSRIDRIDLDGLDERFRNADVLLACDVTNPLLGPEGAIAVFGPQKGILPEELEQFERAMKHYADKLREATGKDERNASGSGAAGGIAFSLRSVTSARVESGFAWLAREGRLEEKIAAADLVITGEGAFDAQSLYGKVPVGIARIAKRHGVPVAVLAGATANGVTSLPEEGIDLILPIADRPMPLETSMQRGEELLRQAAARLLLAIRMGSLLAKKLDC
jgi:glycerate 2-kinase